MRIYIMTPFPLFKESLLKETGEEFIIKNIDRFVFTPDGEHGNQVGYIDLEESEMSDFGFAIEGSAIASFWSYPRFNEEKNI